VDNPADFIRAVADPLRIAILGRAAERKPLSVDELSESFHVPPKKVAAAIGKLRAAGLLDADLQLDDRALRAAAAALPGEETAADSIVAGPWSEEERELLRRFFTGTRLREVPHSPKKRRIVLERLAQEFEPGLRYQERDVDFTLQLFYPDYASLRRYLVDEGLLTRAEGVYWRTGGRYPAGREGD
jgi:hypothetical protein